MAAATVTITLKCNRDLVSAKHASHPENFPGLVQVVIDFLQKELGPDAGAPGSITLSSITIV
jgi:hypothetical protein